MTIAVSSDNECWRWYSGGIISELDGCSTTLDHGVALVGLARSAEGVDYWIVQNSWGKNWGEEGFIYLAVETGEGVTGMNMKIQYMSTDPDYPEEENDSGDDDNDDSNNDDVVPVPVANCDHNEKTNQFGAHTCYSDSECKGLRECGAWGWCQGKSYCDEPLPDLCEIDES